MADADYPVEGLPAPDPSYGPERVVGMFVRMVEGPRYAPMIDHVEAVRGPLERHDRQAQQSVTLTGPAGRTVTYEFGVSKHSGGRFDGCWLTDRVRVA